MTDIKSSGNPLFLREEELNKSMAMLFFAYRSFTEEPDEILAPLGFGRAHHRVIFFVGRNPGISVAQLLTILKVTKQSLSRVLGQLIRSGLVDQRQGTRDRRQRLLYLTEEGAELDRRLATVQRTRLARAFRAAGTQAVEGFVTVLLGIMNEDERRRFERAA